MSNDPGTKMLSTGMHRTCPAQETVERIMGQKKRFGITRLANVTGLDRIGIPVALAIRPNSRSVAVSQGKGVSLDHAKASAVMEATEIWHAETFDGPLFLGSVAEVSSRAAIVDLATLSRPRSSTFSEATRVLWAQGTDLMTGEAILVPHEIIHADYTDRERPGAGCFHASTNGLASGNHPLEAICHALCEVIERDALSVWHAAQRRGVPMRRLDPHAIDEPVARELIERFEAADLDCLLWDITTDLGVASTMAVVVERDGRVGHLGLGSGTHPDRAVALRRALTEAAQTRLNYISGSRDDLEPSEFEGSGMASKTAAFAALAEGPSDIVSFDIVPTACHDTLQGDLDMLIRNLAACGLEQAVWVDLTRDSLDVPVARVVVPGLEQPHDDASYRPGARATSATATTARS